MPKYAVIFVKNKRDCKYFLETARNKEFSLILSPAINK